MMLFTRTAFLILIALVGMGSTSTLVEPGDGLLVIFSLDGSPFRAVVTAPESIRHVLAYVAGEAPPRIPPGLKEGDSEFKLPWSERITRVKDCRSGETGEPRCVTLRGLYAGRSPAF